MNTATTWSRLEPLAALLLAFGLIAAVATDGELPALLAKGLFALLFALDLIVIRWVTRPRGEPA